MLKTNPVMLFWLSLTNFKVSVPIYCHALSQFSVSALDGAAMPFTRHFGGDWLEWADRSQSVGRLRPCRCGVCVCAFVCVCSMQQNQDHTAVQPAIRKLIREKAGISSATVFSFSELEEFLLRNVYGCEKAYLGRGRVGKGGQKSETSKQAPNR